MHVGRWPARWLVSLILAAVAQGVPRMGHAQQIMDARVGAGTPLQVSTASDTTRTGAFLSQSDSELVVQESCGAGCARVARFPWRGVTRIDAAIAHHSVLRAVRGGALGAAYSLALAYAAARFLPCHKEGGGRCPGFGPVLFVPGIVTLGGAVGATTGWQSTDDQWQPVWTEARNAPPR